MNSVPVDEYVLTASLDDFWRTPATIKSRFRIKRNMELVTRAPHRLAEVGWIERRRIATDAPRFRKHARGPVMVLELFVSGNRPARTARRRSSL
jgi:hypothetical protein